MFFLIALLFSLQVRADSSASDIAETKVPLMLAHTVKVVALGYEKNGAENDLYATVQYSGGCVPKPTSFSFQRNVDPKAPQTESFTLFENTPPAEKGGAHCMAIYLITEKIRLWEYANSVPTHVGVNGVLLDNSPSAP